MREGNPRGLATPERRRALRRTVRAQFRLDWQGIHGVPHWARVRWNGLALARRNGARMDVIEWFAFLHDSQRHHDGRDLEHGARAADYVLTLNHGLLDLDSRGLEMLAYACRHHSHGLTEADVTIQTCWDSDRLDLARVGIEPSPARMCTQQARDPEILNQAIRRSLRSRPIR